jgi:hypothetical protein
MKIPVPHTPYIANKIIIDLFNSGYVTFSSGLEDAKKIVAEVIFEDLDQERKLEDKVAEILEENEDNMEFMQVDRRALFWMIKKKMAKDYDVMLNYEDRYSQLAHKVMDRLWQEDKMDYKVSENTIKNIIYDAINGYKESFEVIEEKVYEKISNMKRKLIPGTDEYNTVFERLYREELKKKGMF